MEQMPLQEPTLRLSGLVPYQVHQRDEHDQACLPLVLRSDVSLHGNVEVRVASKICASPWRILGWMDGLEFAGELAGVHVGQYELHFRVSSPALAGSVASISVGPVYVGDLWVMSGQSNMEGRGKLIGVEPPHPYVSCFYLGDRWGEAEEPLSWLLESSDPVDWRVPENQRMEAIRLERRTRSTGAGLGLPFAAELVRHIGVPVGLIISAHGGTSMQQWSPDLLALEGHSLYGALMRRVRQVGGRVKGVLWYQGENDAVPDKAAGYPKAMRYFIASLRRDLNQPNLPFIYAQLSVCLTGEQDPCSWNSVQNGQLELESSLACMAMVPTIDASLSDDCHLDTASLRRVGKRMAWQALRLAYRQALFFTGPRPGAWHWNTDRTCLSMGLTGMHGKLKQVNRVYGFQVEYGQQDLPFLAFVANDGSGVELRFEQPVPLNSLLWHGKGLNPTINIVDAYDIPLPVFGPVTI